jgi:thiosulfate/3-mercaptopyruvate sulfurtransferase
MSYEPIVSVDDLRQRIAAGGELVLLDARPGDAAWPAGHLAGAIHADLNSDLSAASAAGFDPGSGGRHPLPAIDDWTRRLGGWGIAPSTEVVIYDEQDGSNAAARAWWMLRSVGHERVSVLDGGFRAIAEAGLPITTEPAQPTQRDPYPATSWQLPTSDRDAVERLQHDPAWTIIDVRSRPRFRGETEPIDPIAGHIPGAVNLPFAENLENGRWKSGGALRDQYHAFLGTTPPERVIVHCGSGVTACHTLLAMAAAGIDIPSLYVGSWSEWCRNELPRATGE